MIIPWWPSLPQSSTWIQWLLERPDRQSFRQGHEATNELPSSIIDGVGGETPLGSRIVNSDPPPMLTPTPFLQACPPFQQVHVVTFRRDVSQCTEEGSRSSTTSTRCRLHISDHHAEMRLRSLGNTAPGNVRGGYLSAQRRCDPSDAGFRQTTHDTQASEMIVPERIKEGEVCHYHSAHAAASC